MWTDSFLLIPRGTPITIGNLYGPNSDEPTFFQSFFSAITDLTDCPVITAGDFNTVLDPSIDRSDNSRSKLTWQSTSTIKQFISDHGLADSWRQQHPSSREYSFYSPVHRSYEDSLIFNITQSTIHRIIISNHAPVTIQFTISGSHKIVPRWHFNTSLLQDPHFDSFIKKEWAVFLEVNDSP